jgi:hypothetical protein
LDEFVEATGYNRRYALGLLSPRISGAQRQAPGKRDRKPTYTTATLKAVEKVWELSDRLCAKRLVPYLPTLLEALERWREITLDDFTRSQLLSISAATVDRHLSATKRKENRKGLCSTRPGTLLRSQIPIRTFRDWEEDRPGFAEVDLVVHTEDDSGGDYLSTLVLTDLSLGWTVCRPLLHKGQQAVCAALHDIRKHLPFPLLGIDADNGGEFINNTLFAYCRKNDIKFTRGRPRNKNDQCHVEQKNGRIVRALVGYDRYSGMKAYQKLGGLYHHANLWVNFFQPSQKLLEKKREGASIKKTYDKAKTPFQRALDSDQLSDEVKAALRDTYHTLNPVTLRKNLLAAQQQMLQLLDPIKSDF